MLSINNLNNRVSIRKTNKRVHLSMGAIDLHFINVLFALFEKKSLVGKIDSHENGISLCELKSLSKCIGTIPVLLVCSSWFCSVA